MQKIDKLLETVKNMNIDPGVHIITEGYCSMCKGACKALENPIAVIIVNDIPKGSHLDPAHKKNAFKALHWKPEEKEAKTLKETLPLHSLTKEEREFVLQQREKEEMEKAEEEPQKKKYKNLFGYG